MAVSSPRPAYGKAPRAGAVKTGWQAPAKRLGLDSPEHGAMLTAGRGIHSSVARLPASFPRGVIDSFRGSKSCRSMAGNSDDATRDKATKTCHLALDSKHGIYRDIARRLNLRNRTYYRGQYHITSRRRIYRPGSAARRQAADRRRSANPGAFPRKRSGPSWRSRRSGRCRRRRRIARRA